MAETKRGLCAVIFTSRRTAADDAGYAAAAAEMVAEAARQPGFVAIDSARSADGAGITISYWQSEDHALAWRKHARHSEIREQGRTAWYDYYEVVVATVSRDYRWAAASRNAAESPET